MKSSLRSLASFRENNANRKDLQRVNILGTPTPGTVTVGRATHTATAYTVRIKRHHVHIIEIEQSIER
jgi:hypothetical protein